MVVGSGPNGLVAAITLASAGWSVVVFEAASRPGGGTRSMELTLPGVVHDVCSAIHPLGLASPALRELPLGAHGLEWVHPDVPLAHPLDGGRAALLHRSVDATADGLGADGPAYRRMFDPFVRAGFDLTDGLLSPLSVPPRHPITRSMPLGWSTKPIFVWWTALFSRALPIAATSLEQLPKRCDGFWLRRLGVSGV